MEMLFGMQFFSRAVRLLLLSGKIENEQKNGNDIELLGRKGKQIEQVKRANMNNNGIHEKSYIARTQSIKNNIMHTLYNRGNKNAIYCGIVK